MIQSDDILICTLGIGYLSKKENFKKMIWCIPAMFLLLSTSLRSWQIKNKVFVNLLWLKESVLLTFLVLQSKSVLNFIFCVLLVLLSHSCRKKNLLMICIPWASYFPQGYKYISILMIFLVYLIFFPPFIYF